MNFNQLIYFAQTAKTGSMRLAAQNLFISQPSLSAAIRQLENELGFALFTRTNNGVILTEEGQKALAVVGEIFTAARGFEAIKAQTQSHNPSDIACHLKIHTIASQIDFILAEVLEHFKATYPKVTFSISEQTGAYTIDAVLNKISDLGIITISRNQLDMLEANHELECIEFLCEQIYIMVSQNSALAKKRAVTLKSLAPTPLALLIDNNPDLLKNTDDATIIRRVLGIDLPNKIVFKCSSPILLENYVATHDCFSPVFASVVLSPHTSGDLSAKSLKIVPVKDVFGYFCIIYRKDNPYCSVITHFSKLLQNYHRTLNNFSHEPLSNRDSQKSDQ